MNVLSALKRLFRIKSQKRRAWEASKAAREEYYEILFGKDER